MKGIETQASIASMLIRAIHGVVEGRRGCPEPRCRASVAAGP